MKAEEWPRLMITAAILIAFLWALMQHYGTGLEETLKNITMLAVGFWLGSSKGSSDKDRALMETQDVRVVNPQSEPVPTEDKS
jgi:hypothetical protein